ncbi:MAG: hypothetical protein ACRCXK_03255, partial [Wohlfahrtiimonas sp.]
MRYFFSVSYTKPKDYIKPGTIMTFLPEYSKVRVYQRTPVAGDPNQKGTIGAVIFEAPLLLEDFSSDGGNRSATRQRDENTTPWTWYQYPGAYGSSLYGAGWYCNNQPNTWYLGGICPAKDGFYYDHTYTASPHNRHESITGDKAVDDYYLNAGKALARAGWIGNAGDPNIYIEVLPQWKMNEYFPWDNSNSWSVAAAGGHGGNSLTTDYYSPGFTGNASCNVVSATHTTVTKEHYIANPKQVYNADCGLRATHKVFFKSFDGNYFQGGEVRVPLKIDSIVVDVPTEYALSNISLDYNQSCTIATSTAITSAAVTGHVKFINGITDFPRADDCSGNKLAYDLSYDLAKTGTAAPTNYKMPIAIYTRDEFGNVKILRDTASISEQKPELVLTPLTPILKNPDGGACAPAYFDFKIQNNTLYDAPNVYFAAESSLGTTILDIKDEGIYIDPIAAGDVNTYSTVNKIAQLGTIKAGDVRIVRVYANTNLCNDNFNVFADFGCAYPFPLQPDMASTTLDQANVQYVAETP